jgi:hypothetical protein
MKKLFDYMSEQYAGEAVEMPYAELHAKVWILHNLPLDLQPSEIRFAFHCHGATTERLIMIGVEHSKEPAWFYVRHNFVRGNTTRLVSIPLSLPVPSDPGNDPTYLDFALYQTLTLVKAKLFLSRYQQYKYTVRKEMHRRRQRVARS